MKTVLKRLAEASTELLFKFVMCILILVIGLKLISWFIKRLNKSKLFLKLDESLRHFLLSFIRISMYVVLFITVASIVGIPMTSFVALLASAGVAIGLALQGALSNLAGGVMILIFKPFKIGDYVQVSSGEGTVEDITVFYTKLSTTDNKVVTIPNGELTNSAVVNFSAKENRRVDVDYIVSYGSDIDKVVAIMTCVAESHPLVLKDPKPFARLASQRHNSMIFSLKVWCKNSDYWTVHFDMQEKMRKAFDENMIEIPLSKIAVNNTKTK